MRATAFHCPTCRYDLSAIADAVEGGMRGETELMCPECGKTTTGLAASAAPKGDRGWGYFLLWLGAVFGFLMVLGCLGSIFVYAGLSMFAAD